MSIYSKCEGVVVNNWVIKERSEGDRDMMANNNISSVICPAINKFYYLLRKEGACQSGCLVVSFPRVPAWENLNFYACSLLAALLFAIHGYLVFCVF